MVLKCQLPKKSGFCHGNFDSAFQILLDLYLGMEEKEKRHKGLCLTTLSHQRLCSDFFSQPWRDYMLLRKRAVSSLMFGTGLDPSEDSIIFSHC
jgi:hypothetical protein